MRKLIEGLQHFMHTVYEGERDLFAHLAEQQQPEVLFITCSDSRISPHLITQTKPGELFVIRNAGNIVPGYHANIDSGEAATIEYAVAALGVKDVIVCGHSNCGAMKGLLNPEALASLPIVARWLNHADTTRRIVRESFAHLDGDALLDATIEVNVLAQVANLQTHPSVAARVAAGKLNIHAWVYDIPKGEVRAFESETGTFVRVSEETRPTNGANVHALVRARETT